MKTHPDSFVLRPFQIQALESLSTEKSDVICVAPTGSGKSLIYERIAALKQQKTLLITPLIALGRQQKKRLLQAGVQATLGMGEGAEGPPISARGPSAWIVSPERLFPFESVPDAGWLKGWKPSFLVMDECHCLSDWGSRFRPAFSRIPQFLKERKISKSLWLTATLPWQSRKILLDSLPAPILEIGQFALPEKLKFKTSRVPLADRPWALMQEIRRLQFKESTKGIVFAFTRSGAEQVMRLLQAAGVRVLLYHAGISHEEKLAVESSIQEDRVDVVVATSAFGMGMDYSTLKWVILWQAPFSILTLAQAIGRVGRAGYEGEAIVFWDDDDFKLLEWAGTENLLELYHFFHSRKCRVLDLILYFERGRVNPDFDFQCGSCDSCLMHV